MPTGWNNPVQKGVSIKGDLGGAFVELVLVLVAEMLVIIDPTFWGLLFGEMCKVADEVFLKYQGAEG